MPTCKWSFAIWIALCLLTGAASDSFEDISDEAAGEIVEEYEDVGVQQGAIVSHKENGALMGVVIGREKDSLKELLKQLIKYLAGGGNDLDTIDERQRNIMARTPARFNKADMLQKMRAVIKNYLQKKKKN